MLKIYYLDLKKCNLTDKTIFLYPEDASRVNQCINGEKTVQLVGSGLVKRYIQELILHKENFATHKIKYNVNGKPHYKEGNIRFSISTCEKYIIFALCTTGNIGIDIEKIIVKDLLPIKNFFHPQEAEWLLEHPEDLIRIWTRKEAFIKCLGISWHIMRSRKIPLMQNHINYNGNVYELFSLKTKDNYMLSLCIENSCGEKADYIEISEKDLGYLNLEV